MNTQMLLSSSWASHLGFLQRARLTASRHPHRAFVFCRMGSPIFLSCMVCWHRGPCGSKPQPYLKEKSRICIWTSASVNNWKINKHVKRETPKADLSAHRLSLPWWRLFCFPGKKEGTLSQREQRTAWECALSCHKSVGFSAAHFIPFCLPLLRHTVCPVPTPGPVEHWLVSGAGHSTPEGFHHPCEIFNSEKSL